MVLDVVLDRSHPPLHNVISRKLADSLRDWADGWELGDVWRKLHPDDREYSFFSHPHALHTRLDRIFCSLHLLPSITAATYLGKTLADHNPLEISIHWGRVPTPIPTWKLQPTLLEDPIFKAALADATSHYFTENAGTASNCMVEWDAYKTLVGWQ